MVIIGALNNFPYWVAISNAQAIVTHFDKTGWLGAITWCCVLLGMLGTTGNTFLTSRNVSYNVRSIVNGIFMAGGLIGTAFAPNIYIALICIAFVGLSSDFGEGVMLGYFASTSNDSLMDAWGVGTGISGILGAGYSFLCQFFSMPFKLSFLVLAPSGVIYPLAFIFMLDAQSPHQSTNKAIKIGDEEDANGIEVEVIAETDGDQDLPTEDSVNIGMCSCRTWRKTFYYFINNGLVFFLQYVSISGFVDCAMTAEQRLKTPYVYGLLTLVYQAGNLVGRASLRWIKIKRLWLLTLLQALMWVVGLFDVPFRFSPLWFKIVLNTVIGLNGGFSYVNVFNQVMNYPDAEIKEREIMANLTSIGIAGDIMLASAFTLLMQNTFFKNQCLEN